MERLSPQQAGLRLEIASVAYVPIGSIEYHGPHLPLGVDMISAHGLCIAAAQSAGGVVLPTGYLVNGCLDLPYSLTFSAGLVEQWTSEVIEQLHARGAELVVLVTGHGPLDLIHLLKRVARLHDRPGARAYGLCWLELNAARLTERVLGEPTVIDHASTIETSWMMALEPHLVGTSVLSEDPDATITGIYGRNPRFTASPHLGRTQISDCTTLLADRAKAILAGTWSDDGEDLANFVDKAWPEPLEIEVDVDSGPALRIAVRNPGRASRFLTGLLEVRVDGRTCDLSGAFAANDAVGESGEAMLVESLDPEHGIYVRRGQSLLLTLPAAAPAVDVTSLAIRVQLGGVRVSSLSVAADTGML
jgi:creatinine amidohydrolase